ncbi:MAG: divalent metal cation transporter [Roseibacillus sp.]
MNRRSAILTSSAIAAAFIGPGTVTTCAKAGAQQGMALLWALVFSILACLVLQEAAARVQVVAGKTLGEALRSGRSAGPRPLAWFSAIAVIAGCAAYESGNILGGVEGLKMTWDLPRPALAATLALAAGLLLFFGSTRVVVTALSILVGFMALIFLGAAILIGPSLRELISGFVPTIPSGAALLALALVGTTVVPYNLFLGSALAAGHNLRDLRVGLAIAIIGGGLASAAIMVTGNDLSGGEFSLQAVSTTLGDRIAPWARQAFALGLLAAGLTSAITAPLAAALTARSVFGSPDDSARWSARSWRFRSVWIATLLFGASFGVAQIKPVPAIVFAQAANGVLLPLVAIALWRLANDRTLLGTQVNGRRTNLLTAVIVGVTCLLGGAGIWKAIVAISS